MRGWEGPASCDFDALCWCPERARWVYTASLERAVSDGNLEKQGRREREREGGREMSCLR